MKRLLLSILVFLGFALPAQATTWFVRNDGGTRWSAGHTSGQCNGQSDTAYLGSGTNQPCAFGDFRWLYDAQDGSARAWVIAGGDTVIVHGGPWRIGHDQGTTNTDVWCNNGIDNNQTCYIPAPPAGSSGQHTRILGENCISGCPDPSGIGPNVSQLTELFGGFGLFHILDLNTTSFVDWQGFLMDRHSQCIQHGVPALPSLCSANGNFPADDFVIDGIATFTGLHDMLLEDLWIRGMTDRGIIGPIGGIVTGERVRLSYNGMAGWDFDDGNADPSINNPTWTFQDSIIEFSGCNQEWPYVHTYPVSSCYSQSSGGYGDGMGSPPGSPLNVNFIHSISRLNTQDGIDPGHVDTGSSTINITGSQFYGNSGQQNKWGFNFTSANMVNNQITGNCDRMSVALSGAPTTYNANLSDFCRAFSTLSFNMRAGQTANIVNNTWILYSPQFMVLGCSTPIASGGCTNATITWKNNNILGYDNPTTYNQGGGPGGPNGFYCQDNTGAGVPQIDCPTSFAWTRNNDSYFQTKITCPTGYSAETCASSPALVNQPTGNAGTFVETQMDNPFVAGGTLSFLPGPTSPLIAGGAGGAGVPTTDFAGTNTTNPPVIGSNNQSGTTPTVSTPTALPVAGTYATSQSVTISTTTGGAIVCFTQNGATPAATTPGTCDAGSTQFTTAITVASSVVIKAIGSAVGDINSAIASFSYIIAPTLTSITVLPNPAAVTTTTTVNMQTGAGFPSSTYCTFSDSSTVAAGASGCVVVWSDTGAHSSINASTGVVTGISAGSDTVTATLAPATPATATVNVTATPPPGITVQGTAGFNGTSSSPH